MKQKKLKKRLEALEAQVDSLLVRHTQLGLANVNLKHRLVWTNTLIDLCQTTCADNRASLTLLAEGLEPFITYQLDEPESDSDPYPKPDPDDDVHI